MKARSYWTSFAIVAIAGVTGCAQLLGLGNNPVQKQGSDAGADSSASPLDASPDASDAAASDGSASSLDASPDGSDAASDGSSVQSPTMCKFNDDASTLSGNCVFGN